MLYFAFELTVSLLCVAPAPQGGSIQIPPSLAPKMGFPQIAETAKFAPFRNPLNDQPRRNKIAAAGATDLDRNGMPELWFVASEGPDAGQLSVQMPRGSDLGRYRPYDAPIRLTPVPGVVDACMLLPAAFGLPPMLAAVGPNFHRPQLLQFRASGADPRTSGGFDVFESNLLPEFGADIYEIEAADHAGDGLPDVFTLTAFTHANGLPMTSLRTQLTPAYTTFAIDLPGRCDTLRVGDFNGDGLTDAAVQVAGLGVAAFVNTGTSFQFAGGVPLPAGALVDITIADIEGNGTDELLVVIEPGVLIYRLLGTTLATSYFDFLPMALPTPQGMGSLAGVCVVDAWADAGMEVLMLPRDGNCFALYPFDAVMDGFTPPEMFMNPEPSAWTGPGSWGAALLTADVDGDGDLDVAAQGANGAWWTMAGPSGDLRPIDVRVITGPGPASTLRDRITVTLPPHWRTVNPTSVEVVLYKRDRFSSDWLMFRSVALPTPVSGDAITFDVDVWTATTPMPTPTGNALMTDESSMLSVHLRRDVAGHGAQRFASRFLWFGGPTGSDGSAIGVRWRLIATPPLPAIDGELLPWL